MNEAIRKGRRGTDSLRPPPYFEEARQAPRYLLAIAISAALVLAFLVLTYVAAIPPSHLLIIATGLLWLGWQIRKHRRTSR